jgi:Polysaccharide deacetylase
MGTAQKDIMLGKDWLHSGTMAILTYHALDNSGCVLSTPPRVFAEQMRILHELGVSVVPLRDVLCAFDGNATSKNLVAITFDDGFRSAFEYGLPVLQRYGFTATVFLVTDYCGKTNSWPGQPLRVMRRPLLHWVEVREMSEAGIAFGSHTRTHPDLRTVTRRDAEEEMIDSKKAIEDATGRSVKLFAYPYGAYNPTVKRVAQLHFSLACTTELDFAGMASDLLALKRIDTYYLRQPVLFRRLFSRELNTYLQLRRRIRDLRSRVSGDMALL